MAVNLANGDSLTLSSDLPDVNSAYTWMFWFRVSQSIADYDRRFEINTADGGSDWIYITQDNTVDLAVHDGDASWGSLGGTAFTLTPGDWVHVAVVRRSASEIALLVGAVEHANTIATDMSSRAAASDITAIKFFDTAQVAAQKFWTVALSESEIQEEMTRLAPISQLGGLYANWEHSYAALSTDGSGNGHDWTVGGTPTFFREGVAINVGGDGSQLRLAANFPDINAAYTFAYWLRSDTDDAAPWELRGGSFADSSRLRGDGAVDCISSSAASGGVGTGSTTYFVDVWNHFAVVRTATNNFDFYFNGSYVGSANTDVSARDAASLFLARGGGELHFAEQKFWTTDLSAAEVAVEMASREPVSQLGSLHANWQHRDGALAADSSGNGYDLTLINTPVHIGGEPEWVAPAAVPAVSIARYLLANGSGTVCVDDGEGGHDLTLDTGDADAVWTSDGGGGGVDFLDTAGSAKAEIADMSAAGSIGGQLHGAQVMSFVIRARIDSGSGNGSRLFALSTGNGNRDIIAKVGFTELSIQFYNEFAVGGENSYTHTGATGDEVYGTHTFVIVIDLAELVAAARCKLYIDGLLTALTISSSTLRDDVYAASQHADVNWTLGNRGDGARAIDGAIFYAEVFTGKLTASQASDIHDALSAGHDANWRAVADEGGLYASMMGASF